MLLTRIDSIGDFVLFTASLPLYRELFPSDKIVLLVTDKVLPLAVECPFVDEVWGVRLKRLRFDPLYKLFWMGKIAKERFDVAINTVYSVTKFSNLDCLTGWSAAPRRIGFQCLDSGVKRRQKPYFTELVPTSEEWMFEMDRNHALLKHFGFSGNARYDTDVWLQQKDVTEASEIRMNLSLEVYSMVFPGAGLEIKKWPLERFVDVIKALDSPMDWVVCGDGGEYEECSLLTRRLKEASVKAHNVAGRVSLRVLAALAQEAILCLGNDTGPIHIAAAVGTPAVCILGGGHDGRFYPYPDNPLTIAVKNPLPCYGCNWYCVLDEPECITKIHVENVVEKIASVLSVTAARK